MSKFSNRLKRLHTSRVRADSAAEEAREARASVYTADEVQEFAESPTAERRTPLPKAAPKRGRAAAPDRRAECDAWRAIGASEADDLWSLERLHPHSLRHGSFDIASAARVELPAISREVLGLFATPASVEDALFLDIETAGLGEGSGNEAWCVGLGAFEEGGFRVVHHVLPHPDLERPLLREVARRISEASVVVTFNGATFDLPRLSSHFARHDIADPIPRTDQIDLLRVVRRLYPKEPSASLAFVEASLLGFVRHDDVPGAESPRRWARYLRTLDVRPLLPLIEHNRLDIVSLAILLAYVEKILAIDRADRPQVDPRRPVEPARPQWKNSIEEVDRRPKISTDSEEISEFRTRLVRSYRLKSKSTLGKSRERQRIRRKPADLPMPGDAPKTAPVAAGVGDRLTALRRRAAELLGAGNDEAAIPLLHEMVALAPRNPFPLAELARYYRDVGDPELARLFEARLNDVAPY